MSYERFARQYRFEPPSGFPLTSPCTSIVHHLSGPSIYALARHRAKASTRCPGCAQTRGPPIIELSPHSGFDTLVLAHMLDSLVRVSRRVGSHRARAHHPGTSRLPEGRQGWAREVSSVQGAAYRKHRHCRSNWRVLVARPETMVRTGFGQAETPAISQYDSLASNDFTYCFTFFSKSFSSFPHGTCSLSVPQVFSFGRTLPPH